MGMPAARLTDMHTCPICMGAPMPIVSVGAPTVLIGMLPAARMTDMCVCIPPIVPDMIAFGSPTVLILGLPAARLADPTVKGGVVLPPCCPTVLIGLVGVPSPPSPPALPTPPSVPDVDGELPVKQVTTPSGEPITEVGKNITIKGTKAFRDRVVADLAKLSATPTGDKLLKSLDNGNKPVTIVETADGNAAGYDSPEDRFVKPDGSNGPGSGAKVSYNPNTTQIGDGSEPWMTRPPEVGLGHELVHADDAGRGQQVRGDAGGTPIREKQAVGLPPFENKDPSENKLRADMGLPPRPRY